MEKKHADRLPFENDQKSNIQTCLPPPPLTRYEFSQKKKGFTHRTYELEECGAVVYLAHQVEVDEVCDLLFV